MLTDLFVKNFALIDEIRLQFEPGFSVLSGETGAGKTLLVESLSLLLGGKASPTFIRTGQEEAIIEAVFSIENHSQLLSYLEDAGLNEGSDLIIRRQISSEGRSRIYINGQSVTLSQLSSITSQLIDFSGQHEQQVLLNEENHLHLLDDVHPHIFGWNESESLQSFLLDYVQSFRPYERLQAQLTEKRQSNQDREKRIDFLHFQIKEIELADIKDVEEEENLLKEKKRVKNGESLFELTSSAETFIQSGDKSMLDLLNSIKSRLSKAIEIDDSLGEGLRLLEEAHHPLEEAARFFTHYREKLSVKPGRLEEIESRLFQLHQLKKKYGSHLNDILERHIQMKAELDELENFDEVIKDLETKISKIEKDVLDKAHRLSQQRIQVAQKIEKLIQKELIDLKMPQVIFKVSVSRPVKPCLADCGPAGFDCVRFDFSANRGEELKPLAQIASGGELSRILLAVKKIMGQRSCWLTYIFDEIDAGIGGAVAEVVGKKLKEISQSHQVLCVTHLPQIASLAHHHYVIEKQTGSQKTKTDVRFLKRREEREQEIARMLGGVEITSKTMAHAKEMLTRRS